MSKLELAEHIVHTYPLAEDWRVSYLMAFYTKATLIWLENACKSQTYCDIKK